MIKVVNNKKGREVTLGEAKGCLSKRIILAEGPHEIQDILVCNVRKEFSYIPFNQPEPTTKKSYSWRSLYCREIPRNEYCSIEHAIESRLERGMDVYVFDNRKEFAEFLKYRGNRCV